MSLLLRRIARLVTMDDELGELEGVDLLVEDGRVAAIGPDLGAPPGAEVVNARELVVTPGLVNAHQHLYQVGLRCLPELERTVIGPWLGGLGQRCLQWHDDGRLGPDLVRALATAGLAEGLLGGVTTVADQHYLHPAGPTLPLVEATIEAAAEVGVRLHACRGTLTMGRSLGGGADDRLVQDLDEVLAHSAALIAAHHDAGPDAMVRVALAPVGVHADLLDVYRETAALAADHDGVRLHTHLYEVVDTEFCKERYGRTPWELLVDTGWAQPRTWLAHVVDPVLAELDEVAAAGVAVAHLPAPDLRVGMGISPVREMLDAGITVGAGTTGSASNDGANLLADLRLAVLVHRVRHADPERWLRAREVLAMATTGSAACLGRPELGRLAPGAPADLAAWDLGTVDRVGVVDPVLGLLLTGLGQRAALVAVAGRVLVRDGQLTELDERAVAREAWAALGRSPS